MAGSLSRVRTEPIEDDTGVVPALPARITRIVSLVPSLTEAIGESAPDLLVGVTDWCTHPAGLDCARIGGTKNPDLAAVLALRPDVVLVAVEENRPEDLAALRAAGAALWVSDIRTVAGGLDSLGRMLRACGLGRPDWWVAAQDAWSEPAPARRRRVGVPIWRRPWMVAGADTFTTDLLARLGLDNVADEPPLDLAGRYPRMEPSTLIARGAQLVVLPDEPYRFSAQDGPEAFGAVPVALVSGRLLTWYGPSMATARAELSAAIAAARPGREWAL